MHPVLLLAPCFYRRLLPAPTTAAVEDARDPRVSRNRAVEEEAVEELAIDAAAGVEVEAAHANMAATAIGAAAADGGSDRPDLGTTATAV